MVDFVVGFGEFLVDIVAVRIGGVHAGVCRTAAKREARGWMLVC